MLKNLFLYKALFIALIVVSLLFNSFEAVIVLSVLLLLTLFSLSKATISSQLLNILSPLVLIILIAIGGSLARKIELVDFIKDTLYLLKPILFLLIGYLVSRKINDANTFFRIIIYTAAAFSLYHILQFLVYISDLNFSSFSMGHMRTTIGLDNFLELFALALVISKSKFEELKIKYIRLITLLLSLSFILYFSRTMFALLIVLSLAFLGYLRISKKGLKYIFFGLSGLVLFYVYLFSIEIPRDSNKPLENFLYKLKLAPSEIFVPKTSFDIKDHASLWDHWRAYEANMAVEHLNEKGFMAWTFGAGAGSLVDLKFHAPLSSDPKGMRYISILHNGYVFVLYKTGIIGLLLYFTFLLGNYLAYKRSKYKNPFLANIIFGSVLFYLCSSLVVTGIYNLKDTTTLILGGILFLNHKEL